MNRTGEFAAIFYLLFIASNVKIMLRLKTVFILIFKVKNSNLNVTLLFLLFNLSNVVAVVHQISHHHRYS